MIKLTLKNIENIKKIAVVGAGTMGQGIAQVGAERQQEGRIGNFLDGLWGHKPWG